MEQASEGFQAVNDTRPRTVEIPLSVHGIDMTLAYGWDVIPAWQALQRRERSTSLGKRGATGAE